MSADWLGALLSPWVLAILGLCIGSFLNVVIHRLPQMMERAWKLEASELLGSTAPELPEISLSKPGSRCPKCENKIHWYENIPLVSWLALRGHCSACKTSISVRYPLIELATGGLFALVAWRFGPHLPVLAWCAFVGTLLALSGIDWDTTLLPDSLTLPLLWGGLIAAAIGWTIPLDSAVWGAVSGFLTLWAVYWLFKLTTGKEGMGGGDFKLLAALGAWLGWQMLLPIVLGASLIGAAVGIAMKLSGALREGRYVPFGPFLAGAGLVVLFAGSERVMGWLGWA